jgi:hypothetical protein
MGPVVPGLGQYRPAGQPEHDAAPGPLKVPEGQSDGAGVAGSGQTEPAGQVMHDVEPESL